jgi:hypothetical protein
VFPTLVNLPVAVAPGKALSRASAGGSLLCCKGLRKRRGTKARAVLRPRAAVGQPAGLGKFAGVTVARPAARTITERESRT